MDYVPCQYMYSILKITVKNYFKRMRILYVLAWTMTQYKIKGGGGNKLPNRIRALFHR